MNDQEISEVAMQLAGAFGPALATMLTAPLIAEIKRAASNRAEGISQAQFRQFLCENGLFPNNK